MIYPWSKTVIPIALIFSFRMLGLFMLIPIFTVYATSLKGATPALTGLALGSYGLTQGLLQIPFGLLSDKWGRKCMIGLGLMLFALGSLMGALTDSIYGMIAARILQGTGAIGSVLIALLADLTPDEERTKSMAVIGMTIGTSFFIAMILSPSLAAHFGLVSIFYLTAVLACFGLFLLYWVIPTPLNEHFHPEAETNLNLFKSVLTNKQLQGFNVGIFCQHFILTSSFFSIPLVLAAQIKAGVLTQQWHFYVPLILFSFLLMLPLMLFAEKKKQIKPVFLASVGAIVLTQGLLALGYVHWTMLCVLLFVYFIAFNLLEAFLPSLVSKHALFSNRGTAMGLYSTAQFLGIFAGGLCSGLIYLWASHPGIFIMNACLALLWFIVACFMKPTN